MYLQIIETQEWTFFGNLLFRIGVFLILCKAVAYYQRSNYQVFFNPQSKLISEFVNQSNIKERVYEPYFLCLSPFLQSLIYVIVDIIHQKWGKT